MEEILLSKAQVNKAYVINEILLDDIKIARRLSELGFYSGAQIKILAISSLTLGLVQFKSTCPLAK